MRKLLKRTVSIILSVLMITVMFFCLPLTVGAEENESESIPEIAGTSITLNGAVGLNFYVKENENTDYQAYFSYDNSGYEYASDQPTDNLYDDAEYDITGTYRIYSIEVYAKQMTRDITFSLYIYVEGQDEPICKEYTTSVRDYAEKIISGDNDTFLSQQGYTADKISELKDLCKSMLNYGAQAQIQFNFDLDDLANKNIDYTAPEIDPDELEDIDYSSNDDTGAWVLESRRAYQFVNTYDWDHVYVHYLYIKEKSVYNEEQGYDETIYYYGDEIVEEIYPSDYTYNDEYDEDDISNGKKIYIFEPSCDFECLIFTDSSDSLNGVEAYNYDYACYHIDPYQYEGGFKDWRNEKDNSYYNTFYSSYEFVDFVNSQGWSNVIANIVYSEWDEEKEETVSVTESFTMSKTSVKSADGFDVYRFIIPEDYYNYYLTFTDGTSQTTTVLSPGDFSPNIRRFSPESHEDQFADFNMLYVGSSVGLMQKIGYSLFFLNYSDSVPDDDLYANLYYGEYTDDSNCIYYSIAPSYANLGYICYPIYDIAPNDILKPFTVTFRYWGSGDEYETRSYQFTALNYIKRALSLDDSSYDNIQLKATVTALYDYAVKAEAFFD